MTPSGPLSAGQRRSLVSAITDAERGHRGEIVVHVEARYPGDGPLRRAEALFHEHQLERTRDGTAVVLYVAELDRRVAVFAGPGVFGARDPQTWRDVCDRVAAGYRDGDRIAGIVSGLKMLGEILREAAPGEDVAGNELPNEVYQ